ncbi:MAG: dTDP-4-dehydrorhamnose reductase [candidate division Zixibacteria bacterium]|nr:dTDP-4-dehydrorhamnose reductase [candidate division Zixibacteria bacterium]
MACDFLVTGCRGRLGRDLVASFSADHSVRGVDLEEFDIRDRERTLEVIRKVGPGIVLHAAAYTDVDGCEGNRELAMGANADGAENVALACREVGARMVYYSTDYVFDGEADRPYTEGDQTDPQTVYGQSKLAGERAVKNVLDDYVILRIAWLYGRHGRNFVKTVIKLGFQQRHDLHGGREIAPLKVVDDQFGNPCWTMDIARQTRTVLSGQLTGLFHATSEGETSWYGFTQAIFAALDIDVVVEACTSDEFPRPAPRPRRSTMTNQRLNEAGLNVMPDWKTSLETFLHEHGKELVHEL